LVVRRVPLGEPRHQRHTPCRDIPRAHARTCHVLANPRRRSATSGTVTESGEERHASCAPVHEAELKGAQFPDRLHSSISSREFQESARASRYRTLGSIAFAPSESQTSFPPTNVFVTLTSFILSGGIEKMSLLRITISASFPTVIDPFS